MRRKIGAIICILLTVFVFASCKNNNTEENNNTKENNLTTDNNTTDNMVNQPDISDEYIPINPEDCIFVADTDAQPNIGQYPNRAYTQLGYYHIETESSANGAYDLLKFKDYATGKDVPLCSKIDCNHDSKECDAYFDSFQYSSVIFFQNGYIYIPKFEGEYLRLEKISADGSERKISCTLGRAFMETENNEMVRVGPREMQIHRGYAYYSTDTATSTFVELYRVKLDSEEPAEKLCSIGEGGDLVSWLYRIKPYGKYVMFQMGNVFNKGETVESSIYAYNIETGKITMIAEGIIKPYMVMDDSLYYFDEKRNIISMNLETGEHKLFWEFDSDIINPSGVDLYNNNGRVVLENSSVEYIDTGMKHLITIQYVFNEKGEIIETYNSFKDELLPHYVIE